MKKAILIALVLSFVVVLPAFAQNSQTQDALSLEIMALLASLAGLLSSAVVDASKRLPFLSEGEQSKLAGPMAQLVSVIIGIASGYLIAFVGQQIGLIEDDNLKALVITVGAPIVAELRYRLVKLGERQ